MAIVRSTPGTKLLKRYEAGHAVYPFVVSDWILTQGSGSSGGGLSLSSGRLRFLSGSSGANNGSFLRYALPISRSKRFIQYTVRWASGGVGTLYGYIKLIGLGTGGPSPANALGGIHNVIAIPVIAAREYVAGVLTGNTSQSLPSAKVANTDYRFSVFTDSSLIYIRDFLDSFTASRVPATHGATLAEVGFGTFDSTPWEFSTYFDCPDRYVTINVPTGGSAEVTTSGGVVLASAVESGGFAVIDMAAVTLQNALRLRVKNSLNVILDTFIPATNEIVEPGETYSYIPTASPVFTAPIANVILLSDQNITATWSNVGANTYDLEVGNGGGYTPVVTQAGLSYIYTPSLSKGLYRFRVRANFTMIPFTTPYVYSNWFRIGTPTLSELISSQMPLDYWRLEETVGDFLPTGTAFNATPGNYLVGGIPALTRGVDAICNGIAVADALGNGPGAIILTTQRNNLFNTPYENNFAFSQWVKIPQSLGVGRRCLLSGGSGDNVGKYQLGLIVDEGEMQIWLTASFYINGNFSTPGYWQDTISKYTGVELAADSWVLISVEVITNTTTITIKLYLNGVYCADLTGNYIEWSKPLGVPLGSLQPNLVSVRAFPHYGREAYNSSTPSLYGFPWKGTVDEISWFDYVPDPFIWEKFYKAGLATLNAVPVGPFTSLDPNYVFGNTITLSWGAAVGADSYLLRVRELGVWRDLAITTLTTYNYTTLILGNIQFSVIALFNDKYSPEECVLVEQFVSTTVVFSPLVPIPPDLECETGIPVYQEVSSGVIDTEIVVSEGCGLVAVNPEVGNYEDDDSSGVVPVNPIIC